MKDILTAKAVVVSEYSCHSPSPVMKGEVEGRPMPTQQVGCFTERNAEFEESIELE